MKITGKIKLAKDGEAPKTYYLTIDKAIKDRGEIFVEAYATLDEANYTAFAAWQSLTAKEKKKHYIYVCSVKNTSNYYDESAVDEDGTASVEGYCSLDDVEGGFDSAAYASIARSGKAVEFTISNAAYESFGTDKSVTFGINRIGEIFNIERLPLEESDIELVTVASRTLTFGDEVVNLDGADAEAVAIDALNYTQDIINSALKKILSFTHQNNAGNGAKQ